MKMVRTPTFSTANMQRPDRPLVISTHFSSHFCQPGRGRARVHSIIPRQCVQISTLMYRRTSRLVVVKLSLKFWRATEIVERIIVPLAISLPCSATEHFQREQFMKRMLLDRSTELEEISSRSRPPCCRTLFVWIVVATCAVAREQIKRHSKGQPTAQNIWKNFEARNANFIDDVVG